MKASELIKELEKLIKEHGDLECETSEYGRVEEVQKHFNVNGEPYFFIV